MKIGFYVAGYHGSQTFDALVKLTGWVKEHDILFVVTQQTRGIECNYVKQVIANAERVGAHFINVTDGSNGFYITEEQDAFNKLQLQADVIFVIGWQFMFSEILDTMIVLHDSLLPKYRGFAPTVQALIEGKDTIGSTAFRPGGDIADSGPIYATQSVQIEYPIRIIEAYDFIVKCNVRLILQLVAKGGPKYAKTTRNLHHSATYSMWRDELDYLIDWRKDAQSIQRFVDALGWPYREARTDIVRYVGVADKAQPYRYHAAVYEVAVLTEDVAIQDRDAHIGKVFMIDDGKPVIITGSGLIKIKQMEVMQEKDFKLKLRTRFVGVT